MWKWHNDVVRAELERHVTLVAPKLVGVVCTAKASEMYEPTLAALSKGIKTIELGNAPLSDVGVIAVIAENNAAAWTAYTETMASVGSSVPVVYCLPDRRISRLAPGWENSGIHYDGMFKLASLYVPTVERKRGSYVEFGVYDGKSFILACHSLKGVCKDFFAFDSFAGLRGAKIIEQSHFKDEQYSASLSTLQYNFKFSGVDTQNINIVPGFFQESLKGKVPTDYGIESVTMLHVDTDIYEPALLALEFITPALSQGALILFDDFDQLAASNEKGERRAVQEWLKSHPELSLEPYRNYATFGRAFILQRK